MLIEYTFILLQILNAKSLQKAYGLKFRKLEGDILNSFLQ
jgi:hypothetical protein